MDDQTAQEAARIAIALAVGSLALEKTFNWRNNTDELRARWGEILGLLAKTHPA
jgi:hypothetical protein